MNRDVGQTQSCKALNQLKGSLQVRTTAAFDVETLQGPLPRLVLHDIDFHGIDNHIFHHQSPLPDTPGHIKNNASTVQAQCRPGMVG